MIPEEFFTFTL